MEDKGDTLRKLKEQFEKEQKIDASSVAIGDIIYVSLTSEDGLTLNEGYDSRLKYIVVVGFTADHNIIGALLINSKENPPGLNRYQYCILQSKYPGVIDYDSWLDCSQLFTLSLSRIKERVGLLKGKLLPDDLEWALSILRDCDLIDNATKKHFGIS